MGKYMGPKNPYFLVLLIQCANAGMTLISKAAFNGGMNSYVFVFYRQVAGTIFLFPLAIICERRNPVSLTFIMLCKIFLLAFVGLTMAINIYNLVLVYTTATVASASNNCLPVTTFIFAVLLRMENVKIRTGHGIAKITGLVVCLVGVAILAFYKGPHIPLFQHQPFGFHPHGEAVPSSSRRRWIIGCFLAVVAIACRSLWLVMQARVLRSYPSTLYFTSIQSLSSVIQSFVVAIAMERDPNQWKLGWNIRLFAVAYCGTMVSGVSYYLQAWVIKKKGLVFQAMSTPLNFLITTIGSFLLLGEVIALGNILGGILLVISLYTVLWAKGKEQQMVDKVRLPIQDEMNSIDDEQTEITSRQSSVVA